MDSRQKGKRGELELAHWLERFGVKARRGQQTSGSTGVADVIGLEHIHIECKRVQGLNVPKAMEQSRRDAYADTLRAGHEMIPTVFHRENRRPWSVTISAGDLARLAGEDADELVTLAADDFMMIYTRRYGR